MGLYDRDYMRAVFHGTANESSRATRNRALIAVVCVVVLLLAISIGLRYFFAERWNALDRVLNLNSVGWAGIGWNGVDPARIAALGVPCALEIDSVAKGGPADKAGLLRGDLIVGLNGKPFSDVIQLQGDAKFFAPGQTITLNIDRAGTALAVPVTLCSWNEMKRLPVTGGVSL
jgi:membrane-associated protease RseP (regulator of RpoE activity)